MHGYYSLPHPKLGRYVCTTSPHSKSWVGKIMEAWPGVMPVMFPPVYGLHGKLTLSLLVPAMLYTAQHLQTKSVTLAKVNVSKMDKGWGQQHWQKCSQAVPLTKVKVSDIDKGKVINIAKGQVLYLLLYVLKMTPYVPWSCKLTTYSPVMCVELCLSEGIMRYLFHYCCVFWHC